jgi:hypothetical protein
MTHNPTSVIASPQGSFTFEWAHDQRIIIARLKGSQVSEVDFFYNTFVDIIQGWPSQQPYLVVTDSRQLPNYVLTPYMRQKIQSLTDITAASGLQGRTAALVSRTPMLILVKLLVENYINHRLTQLPTKFFFDEEEAIKWLLTFEGSGNS